ncbi:hypothetical protein [Comamonas kerstersii]|uniref:BrnA antitoxin family protein n=1 Tax=Comamonas kerstersii TaxID=225992 RepID=A0A0W7YSB3_9BURK|nr:hypothetical protein [Comamonas kerstersii]KUF37946.1 hypothetical protein AS359_04350 [Comamonas kerstersii]DAG25679.1 MAG TPA: Transcriptional repressor arc(10) helix, beta-ribbon, beta-sheet, structural [Caudoviricetes sp.]
MNTKIESTDKAWDERQLGASAEHAQVASAEHLGALNDALGMQSISIRLPKEMIEAYKMIAAHHGVGYQPLMRDILQRFIPEGLKEVMAHHVHEAKEAEERMEEMRKVA